MVVVRARHTPLKAGKKAMFATAIRPGDQPVGVTQSSTVVAWAPIFQEVAIIIMNSCTKRYERAFLHQHIVYCISSL